jgi:hypothetical protein
MMSQSVVHLVEVGSVIDDVERIRQGALSTGLELNPSKCEVIGFPDVAGDLAFDGFARVGFDDAELLGSPLARGSRQNAILEAKCIELERAMSRLNLIDSHYAFSIISNCISAPKLLYTLRTSCCVGNDLLARFDSSVKVGLETVLNVCLSDAQWLQASLPVHEGGLGVRSVVSLAPSAFLASAASTRELQNQIIPDIAWKSDMDYDQCLSVWCELTSQQLQFRHRPWSNSVLGTVWW